MRVASLFGLAPCGVLPAICLTADAVRSYRTFSPLPTFALRPSGSGLRRGWPTTLERPHCEAPDWREPAAPKLEARSAESEGGRCIFCATVLRVAPTGRYPAHCPAEFGLSSRHGALRRLGPRSSVSLRPLYCTRRSRAVAATEIARLMRRLASLPVHRYRVHALCTM